MYIYLSISVSDFDLTFRPFVVICRLLFCKGIAGREQDKQDFRYHNDKYGLWGNSVDETIEEVKRRWNIIPGDLKPQWCTVEDIAELERKAKAN